MPSTISYNPRTFMPFERTNQPLSHSRNNKRITHYNYNDSVTFASLVIIALSITVLIFATIVPQYNPFPSIRPSMTSVTTSVIDSPAASVIATASQPIDNTMVKKNSREDREWNRLAIHMDSYHNSFRLEFKRVYALADGGYEEEAMKLPRFLRLAQQLSSHLSMHHRIEETYIFPILSKKMPQFAAGKRESGEHLVAHKKIHDGLDKYDHFLSSSIDDPSVYNGEKLREIMDSFREVLFTHLDEEVKDLHGERMRAAGWTLEEMKRIPM
ncbi:hypothetical protein C343_03830 [Cryptococcus neoformans C23]|uniref:Hemerythrin-like domain-containing protein n=2 Tax=Cryptococcus neoformans TaxID=5207 RepID=A0A854Q947_CRYNE|nr:hypothetical protein CNAG_02093 [Cryptococcus neoformans var. grubii H99]AUB25563.1 hypothetical protein CKF44_02093 [Cryptococcus neoformans var. grubii]OWZ43234.1 hypothetical protein C343_03830 [Cryptococcus neoformans var. grubii C23]OWZ54077.1 hypothetical protein C368_03832 [Cryptococcus neoformans var. grubii 125.91]OXC84112.1 hypothetical protein C344_03589 [Cryptococcus neoformans var. grubii AD1-7a]OXG19979.1 hypothetical protein C361_04040 [Cryptococcus neoformans var. grubii Tu2|eukprot:XP_012049857.1 hypothetical protein CNAG_02093 [Cryptococcus neoformans var. grubii H99]